MNYRLIYIGTQVKNVKNIENSFNYIGVNNSYFEKRFDVNIDDRNNENTLLSFLQN